MPENGCYVKWRLTGRRGMKVAVIGSRGLNVPNLGDYLPRNG
jgi:hypothetical protein